MSLAILFHFLCTEHISDINISIIRSLRLCCWISKSVVEAWNTDTTQTKPHQISNTQQNDRFGNSTTQSQAPDDGYINIWNMLST